jgi:uncharacterized membrane protein YozB (DUF420 family)
VSFTENLPVVNACLNAASATLVVCALVSIKGGHRERHERLMLAAVVTSSLFLVSYLVYHALHGSTRYEGEGFLRTLYLGILLTHTVLAVGVLPLVLLTVWRALKKRYEKHKRIARWTAPIWLYVSVTGVVIYLMLYQFPPAKTS